MATNLGVMQAARTYDVIQFCKNHSLSIGDLFAIVKNDNGYSVFYNTGRADTSAPTIHCGGVSDGQGSAEAVPVYASVSNWSDHVSFKLYYKGPGAGVFSNLPMKRIAGDVYLAYIPASSVATPAVEWYLETADAAGNTGNYGTAGVPKTFTVV